MKPTTAIYRQEDGFILVLAIFMLALLSMIGIAAMMTTTTEVDLVRTERVDTETFYNAEVGLYIAAEIIERLQGTETVTDDTFIDDNDTIIIRDGEFMIEAARADHVYDNSTDQWNWNWEDQTVDAVCRNRRRANTHAEYEPDIEISAGFLETVGMDVDNSTRPFIDIDVDKIMVRQMAGGGAEFGVGAEGAGVAMHEVHYLIHSIAFLPASDSFASEKVMGYRFIPRN